MTRQIFRKVALERLSSPEQLDQLMQVTTPAGWLSLLALGGLLLVALCWGVWGSLPIQVSGPMILMIPGGVKTVVSPYAGQISDLAVKSGDRVQKGQLVATIVDPGQTNNQAILSPYTGHILEIDADEGSLVDRGTALLTLEQSGRDTKLEALIYLSPTDGKRVRTGMDVQLSPSTVHREEFGFLLGKVTVVGEFPTTYQGMLRTLGNDELVKALHVEDAPVEIHADLILDPATTSGYKWSSAHGPSTSIQNGTLGAAVVIIGQQRPFGLLFR